MFQPTLPTDNGLLRYLVNNNRLAILAAHSERRSIQYGQQPRAERRCVHGCHPSSARCSSAAIPCALRAPRSSTYATRASSRSASSMNFEFIAESTNLFNRTNVTGLNSRATVDTLGNIVAYPSLTWTSALDQRLLQLGLRFNF